MKKINKKQKRRFIAMIFILIILSLLLWFFFRKKDFLVHYKVNDFSVTEKYSKKENTYWIDIEKNGQEYHTLLENANFFSKKIIYQIEEYQEENETCLKIHSNKKIFNPLCVRDKEQISIHLTSEKMKSHFTLETLPEQQDSYEQISIHQLHYHDFYIWNYRGFYHINNNKKEEINLFSKDIYDAKLKLMTQVEDVLWIPDYNEDYFFKKVYILNAKTGKQEVWNLDQAIYFDSQVLGVIKNEIYLLDKHEKVEWKINLKNKKMTKIGSESMGGKTYQHGWQEVSMSKLLYQDLSFQGISNIDYETNENLTKTFANHSILIRSNAPSKIIKKESDAVYYLVGDTLYSNTDTYGELPLLSYFEWNFNNDNVIFIF